MKSYDTKLYPNDSHNRKSQFQMNNAKLMLGFRALSPMSQRTTSSFISTLLNRKFDKRRSPDYCSHELYLLIVHFKHLHLYTKR